MPPPLSQELLDQAVELEAYVPADPDRPGLLEVPLDAVNRATRLLRTASDVVAHATWAAETSADRVDIALGLPADIPPAYRHRLAAHVDDSGI